MLIKRFIPLTLLLLLCVSCSNNTKPSAHLVDIPEASGIDYCHNSESLVVANDEGSYYEISKEGKINNHVFLGDYDLEGVVCHDAHFVFAVEEGYLLRVNRKSQQKTRIGLGYHEAKITKKRGIEGLAYHEGLYYISIQNKTDKLSKILVAKIEKDNAKVTHTIEHIIKDAAGMVYAQGHLYIVSDKKDKLYSYDLEKQRIVKKIPLQKFAQEGITFDTEGYVYFADDGGSIQKYKAHALGL